MMRMATLEKIPFKLESPFKPSGSQPQAIAKLIDGLKKGMNKQALLGVTGSGKTFTMANVIANLQRPTLVLAHNKTLAAQLYEEFREFFPKNRVEYFVSYYDYYTPECYIPQRDMYIEKDSQVNPRIEQMRLAATASLLSRSDTIVVSSVSCIYGLGNPENFGGMGFELHKGEKFARKDLVRKLSEIQFERNDTELMPGRFRVQGDTIDLVPGYYNNIVRISLSGDKIDEIRLVDKTSGTTLEKLPYFFIYPARHFVTPPDEIKQAITSIRSELEARLPNLPPLEAQRLKQRTLYDLELIEEIGFCKGIENYSRHFDGRKSGQPPFTLMDYFPKDFLLFIDESHQTIPQLHGMYHGDYSRKKSLIDYGFRLPSAFDNRPLKFAEFERYMNNTIFVSATPGPYERENSLQLVEQIIRPTGLVDPIVEVRSAKGQVEDLLKEIQKTVKAGNRVLATTLTKKLSEELSEFLLAKGIKAKYLHSEIETLERTDIIRDLRLGKFDVLVGINLLREGLDIPEVGFIGILDADKEGFLRNETSLIQTIGRAARNSESRVVLYAEVATDSVKNAVLETDRRRKIQMDYNKKHGITPKSIIKPVKEKEVESDETNDKKVKRVELPNLLIDLESQMKSAAETLDFERAIALRERIKRLHVRIEAQ